MEPMRKYFYKLLIIFLIWFNSKVLYSDRETVNFRSEVIIA